MILPPHENRATPYHPPLQRWAYLDNIRTRTGPFAQDVELGPDVEQMEQMKILVMFVQRIPSPLLT